MSSEDLPDRCTKGLMGPLMPTALTGEFTLLGYYRAKIKRGLRTSKIIVKNDKTLNVDVFFSVI